jgi:hypothetical protein
VDLDAALAFIRELGPVAGFPILVALWFMLRLERRLEHISNAQEKLLVTQAVLLRTFDSLDGSAVHGLISGETEEIKR